MQEKAEPIKRPFQLGLGLAAYDYDVLRQRAAAADRGGFAFVSTGDNPALMKDTYVSLTMVALATQRCRVGTGVTNCLHRDLLVTAAAISSIESISPGRTFLGIATGRARTPAKMQQLRHFVVALKDLWSRGETTFNGETLRLSWDAKSVPVLLAVSGPRGLRLAGEIADGVICEAGVDAPTLESTRAALSEGARLAGRDPDALEVWSSLKTSIADTHEEALDHAASHLAAVGALTLGHDPARLGVPDRFQDLCRDLAARYDKSAHLRTDPDNPNRKLVRDPEFRRYLVDRFGVIGNPQDWTERLEELAARGVERVFCVAVVPDLDHYIELVGRQVLSGSRLDGPAQTVR